MRSTQTPFARRMEEVFQRRVFQPHPAAHPKSATAERDKGSAPTLSRGAMRLTLATVAVMAAGAQAAYAQSCNLAANGSFESPNIETTPEGPGENTGYTNGYPVWRTSTAPIDGWQTVSGTRDILSRYYGNTTDGVQSIDMFGVSAATLRQTFTGLNPGQQYRFSIDYSGHNDTHSPALVQLGNGNGAPPVTVATLQPVADSVANGPPGPPTTPVYTLTWATYQHTFTAAGTEATIQFVETGTGSTGLFIDNFTFVSVDACETDLAITKDDGATAYTPGVDTTYTINVTNNGPFEVTDAVVNDPLPAGVTSANWTCVGANGGVCGAAAGPGGITNQLVDLPAGGSVTYSLTLTPPPGFTGDLVNTATVANPVDVPDPSPANNVASDTDQQGVPAMTIDKTGTLNDLDGDGLLDPGETINYVFFVTNTGNVTLTNVTVDDPLVTVAEAPQTLTPGGNFTFTANYTPTQADIDSGSVVNTATATGVDPGGNPYQSPPDTTTTPPDQTPAMTIDKTGALNDLDGDGLLDPGETINYAFLVTNTGNVTLTNVTVNDTLVTVDQAPQTLARGGSFTFTANYTPTQADIDAGSVVNTATATGVDPGGAPYQSPPDTATTPPDRTAGMALDKTGALNDLDGDGLIDPGETISYSFLVTNRGNVTLTNVTVNDPLVNIDQGPQTLAPGDSFIFTAGYTPTQADIDAGSVINTAVAQGVDPGGAAVESSPDTTTTPPDQTPGLRIQKTGALNDLDGDGLLDLGETIHYSFLVTNGGNVTLSNVTVNDPLVTVDQGPQTLAPGGRFTFTASYTPTQANIDAGSVVNTATATGSDPGGAPFQSPPDTATTPPDQTRGMTVRKTGALNDLDGDGLLDPGETIDYSFLVTNRGNVTLTNVRVNDPLLANAGISVTPGPQTLAPGRSATFTASYTPTQAEIDAGSVVNTATATGVGPGGAPYQSPPDTITTPPAPAALTLRKTGAFNDVDGNGHASVGDTLTYTLLAANEGGQTVSNVSPDDPGPTFNGRPASNAMAPFAPSRVTLPAGASHAFRTTYVLTQEDIDNAVGVGAGISNSATARGLVNGVPVSSSESTSDIPVPSAEPGDLSIIKQADLRHIRRGEHAPFTIRLANNAGARIDGLVVTDTTPSGFRYVDGSAAVNGEAATPVVNGRNIRFENLSIEANSELNIQLRLLALSSAGPGEHVNRASVTDAAGALLAPTAQATVEILIEPVFDCGDIVGKVFDDADGDGYQDDGEPGLPGVRVTTVEGWLITTDEHGRFHVACADLPDSRIGSNFIAKLDTRTLPTGYRLTTENPRVVRLTAGKLTRLNFGASIGRVVRFDMSGQAFESGGAELTPEAAAGIDKLIDVLGAERSVLRLSYIDAGTDAALAEARVRRVRALIMERWREQSGQYPLNVETRVEAGQ